MQKKALFFYLLCSLGQLFAQEATNCVVTQDIDNFWATYDQLQTTKDSVAQLEMLQAGFFDKGTEGLKLIGEARRYTAAEYLGAIRKYPLFWASVRENTLKAKTIGAEIEAGIAKFKKVYPELKPAKVYFTIGALRTSGTAMNGQLLIGSELAMADANTNSSEFVTRFSYLKPYFAGNPLQNIVFLNIHEYVHTQQTAAWGYDLLSQSLFEGIAEFIPTVVLGQNSTTPAIEYGKKNEAKVKAAFEKEMFSPWFDRWVWNDFNNEFKMRDLGYYIGYAIAEKYYLQAKDKQLAIKELLAVDFNKSEAVEAFVEKTGYFTKPIKQLKKNFEKNRPTVIGIREFKNGSKNVDPNITSITFHFSTPLNKCCQSTDFGALGETYFPEILSKTFAEDGKSIIYQVKLKPNRKYQFVLERGFRSLQDIPLKPYIVEITTKA
ncbi:MAG: hypothetical protein ACKVTZ_21980 [Bacteroidia bacterium]